ncbi:MAG: biopolymer transporter ExbD [Deltaproteobacteria bacterium]|nr:biopolymer transporter ExbD [Deltaproteobacteria bacterium]
MIKFSQRKISNPGDVNLTPMIDIIFNLLIFFLIVAVISQKGLNLTLPKTSTAEKRPDKSLEISVTGDKRILFNGKEISLDDVEKKLREEKMKKDDQKADNILLKADVEAPFGMFVTVMDTARKVGLTNLVIATKLKTDKNDGGNK